MTARLLSTLAIGAVLAPTMLFAEIKTEEITYSANGTELKGFLAFDTEAPTPQPGILVVHEWWGHNEYARKRAEMLAELGYTAFAVDMYGDGKTAEHPKDAGAFASAVMSDPEAAQKRFVAAMDLLKQQPTVNPDRIAAIGYCFGGAVVLNMARLGVEGLDAVASFHGSLSSPIEPKGPIKARILVAHGADDGFIPEEQVTAFKKQMEEAGADMTFISYEGAKHSFTNPGADKAAEQFDLDIGYQKEADEKSWEALQEFLEETWSN